MLHQRHSSSPSLQDNNKKNNDMNKNTTLPPPKKGWMATLLFTTLSLAMGSVLIYLVYLTVHEHKELHQSPEDRPIRNLVSSITQQEKHESSKHLPRLSELKIAKVKEFFITKGDLKNNLDSLQIWHRTVNDVACM
jgi:hypothetical protein